MTTNQIVRVIPVLKVNNRNVNQDFYEETLGMKVLVEEGALLSLGDAVEFVHRKGSFMIAKDTSRIELWFEGKQGRVHISYES